jgi:hypothetical protein
MFTTARHWSLSWARCIQFTPSHPASLRSILILSSHLHVGLLSGIFTFSDHSFIWIFHFSHACCMHHPSHPPWFDHPNNIEWSVQIKKLLIMQSSPSSGHCLTIRSKFICPVCYDYYNSTRRGITLLLLLLLLLWCDMHPFLVIFSPSSKRLDVILCFIRLYTSACKPPQHI